MEETLQDVRDDNNALMSRLTRMEHLEELAEVVTENHEYHVKLRWFGRLQQAVHNSKVVDTVLRIEFISECVWCACGCVCVMCIYVQFW